jgi:hypothetical protein
MAIGNLRIGDTVISRPLENLFEKFGLADTGNAGRWVSWPTYDGYVTPAERAGNYDTIEQEDLLITAAQNSRLRADAVESLRRYREDSGAWLNRVSTMLRALPRESDIADADDECLALVDWLFDSLEEVHGIGPAVAGKILARKRPGIAPMLDSVVMGFVHNVSMRDPLVRQLRASPGHPKRLRVLHAFRAICLDQREKMSGIAEALDAALEAAHGKRFHPRILRVAEALIWMEHRNDE